MKNKKGSSSGNIYILVSIGLSAIFITGGMILKGLRPEEKYVPVESNVVKDEKDEKAEKKEAKNNDFMIAIKKDKEIQEIIFSSIDAEKKIMVISSYPGNYLVEKDGQIMTINELKNEKGILDNEFLEKNFKKKELTYIEADSKIINQNLKIDKNLANEIFSDSLYLNENEYLKFKKAFKIIEDKSGIYEKQDEYRTLIKEIEKDKTNFKEEKINIEKIRVGDILDPRVVNFITDKERNMTLSYSSEELLNGYEPLKKIMEKQEKKLEEIAQKNTQVEQENNNTRPTPPTRPTNPPKPDNTKPTKPDNIKPTDPDNTKPDSDKEDSNGDNNGKPGEGSGNETPGNGQEPVKPTPPPTPETPSADKEAVPSKDEAPVVPKDEVE